MKETEMNDLKQIHERFLAHARQHFFSGNVNPNTAQCSSHGDTDHSCTHALESVGGQDCR